MSILALVVWLSALFLGRNCMTLPLYTKGPPHTRRFPTRVSKRALENASCEGVLSVQGQCHAVVASWRRVAESLWIGGVRAACICQSCHVTRMACVHWRAGCSAARVTTLWHQSLIHFLRERHEGSTDNFIWVDFRPYCGVHYDFYSASHHSRKVGEHNGIKISISAGVLLPSLWL